MSHSYSTALSHIVLAGTGIYCVRQVSHLPLISYGLIITNSVIGIWRYGNPEHGDSVEKPFSVTTLLQKLFALPCIVTSVWLSHGLQREIAYIHVAVSLIPLIAYIADKDRTDLIDAILGVNVISLAVVSFIDENYWGLAAAVSYAIAHFVIRDEGDFMDIPSPDLYNYGLCFFSYFALRALTSSIASAV